MHPDKAEFKRLIEIVEWSQTEAARRLHKTPSAINHLVNPGHPNKPTQSTLLLLKFIISRERPDLLKPQDSKLRRAATRTNLCAARLSPKGRQIIERLKQLPAKEKEIVYDEMKLLLRVADRKRGKARP